MRLYVTRGFRGTGDEVEDDDPLYYISHRPLTFYPQATPISAADYLDADYLSDSEEWIPWRPRIRGSWRGGSRRPISVLSESLVPILLGQDFELKEGEYTVIEIKEVEG